MDHDLKEVQDKNFVECFVSTVEFVLNDPIPQELLKSIHRFIEGSSQFFDGFYSMRNKSVAYAEAFNGYKKAKSCGQDEQQKLYSQKLEALMEEYHLTKADYELYLSQSLSKEEMMLFTYSVGSVHRQFRRAVKNDRGLGFFKSKLSHNNIKLALDQIDLKACTCTLKGFDQPISITFLDEALEWMEAERGNCYFLTAVRLIECKRGQFQLVFESIPCTATNSTHSFKIKSFPVHLMEKQRIL